MKTVIQYFIALLLLLTTLNANAQMPPGGMPKGGSAMMKSGKFYGKVIDSKTGKAIDAASVVLTMKKDGKDQLVTTILTTPNGDFSLEDLVLFGQYQLTITAIGYTPSTQNLSFDLAALMKAGASMQKNGGAGGGDPSQMTLPDNLGGLLALVNKDLGNISLKQTAEHLSGVTITAATPQFVMQGEKKIFNVANDLTAQGGTATDVMKSVPGVLVDADGNVTIRNSAPQILVDGKQSPLTLDQIPADAIESIEVITNPSAKYDAEGGTGGVLNVVLKKNKKQGYNGNIRAGVDSHGGGNIGGDFNYRKSKFNLSINANGNLMHNETNGYNNRTDFSSTPNLVTDQNDNNKTNGGFAFGKIGLDYFITNRTTISIGGVKVHGEFKPTDNLSITTDTLYNTGGIRDYSHRTTNGENQFNMNGAQFGLKHIFPKAGEEWTFDATGNFGHNKNYSDYSTNYFTDATEQTIAENVGQKTNGTGTNNFYTLQSDYSLPFANSSKLDVGVKATIRYVESTIDNYYQDPSTGAYTLLANPNSNYNSTDQIYAAYGSYSGNVSPNTSYQLGLRAESYEYTGHLEKTGETFSNKYPVSLFPSVFLSQKLKHDQQLQFSYRRGINRPNFFQLLPFTDYTDPLNIRQGNPGLKPEFTNSVELTYMKNFTRANYIMASVYYRHSTNLITQYQTLGKNPFDSSVNAQEVLINTYINASSSDRYGVELTSGWDLAKWWNILANVNLYNAKLTTGVPGTVTDGLSYFSGFGKLTNNFKLPKKFSLQVSGLYQSKTSLLPDNSNTGFRGGFNMQQSSSSQGYLEANWSVDAALRFTFMKNDAASLSLSVNDIFGTRKFVQHTESSEFVQDYSRLINPHMVRLNFAYKFGKIDTDLFRRKNVKGQMENMQDVMQGSGS